MSPSLRARGLSKRYGRHTALREVDFEAGPGELVAILGPNGAGKTTLLSILAGIQQPSDGEVVLAPGGIGWAPQQPALYSKLTVRENLALFARLAGAQDPAAAVERMLGQTGLADRAAAPVGVLSGGNRQRVNVAVALLAEPAVLALDEPSASLDPAQRERLWGFLETRAAAGTSVVFSSHNPSEAQRHASRVLVLAQGRLMFDGPPQALLEDPRAGGAEELEQALVAFLDVAVGGA